MTKIFEKEKLPFILIGVYLLFTFIWYFLTEAPWDDDCVTRYYSTRNALDNPKEFLSRWNRPLFVMLFVLPFQLSKHFILLMPLYSAIGVYFFYKACLKLKVKNAIVVIPLILFQAYFYGTSRASLAEPLAAIIICLGFYFMVEKKWLWFAIIGGLLPLARLELSLLLLAWGIILLKEKQYKYILILGLPTALWSLGGTLSDGDPVWLLTQTLGSDKGTNRYGNTTFQHYFIRYIFVTGPVIFYFFIVGFIQDFFKKKISLFVHLQFFIGFMTYVLFSWKLSLGQAAGFLRHLIALAPLAAIISLNGINHLLKSIFKAVNEIENEEIKIEKVNNSNEKETVLAKIKAIEAKRDAGEIKNRNARHLINQLENKLQLLEPKKEKKAKKQVKENTPKSKNKILLIVISIIIPIVTYLFLSRKLEIHHNLMLTKDYTNFYIIAAISLFFISLLLIPNLYKNKSLRFPILGLIAIGLMSFTLITEPPNVHNSHERKAMTRISKLYEKSDLTRFPAYVNHYWLAWVTDFEKDDFGIITQENLEAAPDSSIIIWDSHYSHRLAGDVQAAWFNNKPEYVELINHWSSKLKFNVRIYQKLKNGGKIETLAVNERMVEQFPNEVEVYATKAAQLFKLKKLAEAEVAFKEALNIDSTNYMLISSYATLKFQQKKFKEAEKLFTKNIKIKEDFYSSYYNKALCLANLGNADSAIYYYGKSIEHKPEFFQAYQLRGNAYYKKNMLKQALADFQLFSKKQPKDPNGYFNQAVCKMKLNQNACVELQKAKQLGHKAADQYINQQCNQKAKSPNI